MSDVTEYIDRLRRELEGARAALGRETLRAQRLEQERDTARANARILAHAYTTDNRPPQRAVDESLAYPAVPERVRRSAWERGNPVIERKRPGE